MKKTLSMVLALVMTLSVMFALPLTANAAGVNAFNDYMVSDMAGLSDALVNAEGGTRICLIDDIKATPYYPYPIGVQAGANSKGGNVVLDMNGFSIDITTTTMTNLFNINQQTQLYVINGDPEHKSSINFNTTKSESAGNGSVFLLDNVQATLIVSGVDITMCKDSQPTQDVCKESVITCKDFYHLYIYGSELTNFATPGSGILFKPKDVDSYMQSYVKVYNSKITSTNPCIEYDNYFDWTMMFFMYSELDCDERYYKAFDLPSKFSLTFGDITGRYADVANSITGVCIDPDTKVVDFDEKCDLEFISQLSCEHVYDTLVNTADGHYKYCVDCGISTGYEAHNGKTEAVAATCTTDGRTEGYNCTCGYKVTSTTIAKTGHQHTEAKAEVPATCTEKGYTAGVYCNDCKTWISGHEEIAAKGHTEVIDAAVAPTCAAAGKTEGKHCSVCNAVLVAQTVVAPTGKHT
ncbi:MAG: hypothetical protein ACI4RU_05025 [Acutalibacteraceae bacterium]